MTAKFFTIIFTLLLLGTLLAQRGESVRNEEGRAYILDNSKHVDINIVKDELKVTNSYFIEKKLLHNQAQAYADTKIHYSQSWHEIHDIEAMVYTYQREGVYKKKKVNYDFDTKSSHSNSIFIDDNRFKEINYPTIKKGDKVSLSYKETIKDPHFISGHFFSSYLPTDKSKFSISFPDDVQINYKVFNNTKDVTVHLEKSIIKGRNIYTWEAKDIREFTWFNNAPNIRYYEPHIVVAISNYTVDNNKVEVLGSVNNLYDWYGSLVKEVNKKYSDELIALADSLTKGIETKPEKVKRIFYWVQDNIKYVAFETGLGGFVPRDAVDVLSKRYGDCKDMASIITSMCKLIGIEASLTWIGSRDIPYTYESVPSPSVDNHMIATVKLDGLVLFLDATGSYTQFGMPTSFIQGKEAMVYREGEVSEIIKVPVVDKELNTSHDIVSIEYSGGQLTGEGHYDGIGFIKFNMTNRLKNKTKEQQLKILTNDLGKGSNKFIINDIKIYGLHNRDSILNIEYDFDLNDYAKLVNNNLYINPHLSKPYYNDLIDISLRMNVPLEIPYKKKVISENRFKIPPGFELTSLPQNVSGTYGGLSFKIDYKIKDDQVIMVQTIMNDTIMIYPDEFVQWNKFVKSLNYAYNQVLVFTKS